MALSQYEVHGVIDEADWGKVLLASKATSSQLFAMKVVRKEHLVSGGRSSIQQVVTEKSVLQKLALHPHPFVTTLHHAFQNEQAVFLVTDYVGGGDLYSLVAEKGTLPEPAVCIYAAALVLVLEHLHGLRILLRDLRPESIMLGMDGYLKVADFGMSQHVAESGPLGGDLESMQSATLEYLAPEILLGKPHNEGVDWWGLGCLLYELLVGHEPFHASELTQLVQQILGGKLHLPAHLSEEAMELISGLLRVQPVDRMGSAHKGGPAAVKATPFFAPVDWGRLARKEVDPSTNPAVSAALGLGAAGRHRSQKKQGGAAAAELEASFAEWTGPALATHNPSNIHPSAAHACDGWSPTWGWGWGRSERADDGRPGVEGGSLCSSCAARSAVAPADEIPMGGEHTAPTEAARGGPTREWTDMMVHRLLDSGTLVTSPRRMRPQRCGSRPASRPSSVSTTPVTVRSRDDVGGEGSPIRSRDAVGGKGSPIIGGGAPPTSLIRRAAPRSTTTSPLSPREASPPSDTPADGLHSPATSTPPKVVVSALASELATALLVEGEDDT